jgi:hypothetical protein
MLIYAGRWSYTLDKTERAIKNGHPRDIDDTGRRQTKQKQTKNTQQSTENKNEQHGPTKNLDRTHVLSKGKQFLPLISQQLCY